MEFAATRPFVSKTKITKHKVARNKIPVRDGRLKELSKSVPQAESITKKPQNIKQNIKSFRGPDRSLPPTASISSSNEDAESSFESCIITKESAPKARLAKTIPVKSWREERLKYSKISLPDANPAPITSPMYTAAMLKVFFIIIFLSMLSE